MYRVPMLTPLEEGEPNKGGKRTSVSKKTYSLAEDEALRALVEAGYPNLQASDLARLLPPGLFEDELLMMADVRAYYHVAYKVSCFLQLRFKALIALNSVSSIIFLLPSNMVFIIPWQNNFLRAFSRTY